MVMSLAQRGLLHINCKQLKQKQRKQDHLHIVVEELKHEDCELTLLFSICF